MMPTSRRHGNFRDLTRKDRSVLMSRIRSSGSKMESGFAAILESRFKGRLELNDRTILGKPDVVFREEKVCVFLDSDFWHGWQYPRWKHRFKGEFWRTKIERNRQRDKEVTRKLRRKGWTVIRFWEHSLRGNMAKAIAAVTSMVHSKKGNLNS